MSLTLDDIERLAELSGPYSPTGKVVRALRKAWADEETLIYKLQSAQPECRDNESVVDAILREREEAQAEVARLKSGIVRLLEDTQR